MGKKYFECKVHNRTYLQQRTIFWRNTNKMLNYQGFVGVKTGITPAAGPCLVSMFDLTPRESIVIVLLKVKSMERRFEETLLLL